MVLLLLVGLFLWISLAWGCATRMSPSLTFSTSTLFLTPRPLYLVAISLPHRKTTFFDPLAQHINREWGPEALEWFSGIDGKTVNWRDYPMTKRYRRFFDRNERARQQQKPVPDYRGHLGATLSHLSILRAIQGPTIVLEDDACPRPHFRTQVEAALQAVYDLDPEWDLLLLGWCCRYRDHGACKQNDREPVHPGGLVKLHYFFGGWGYVVRDRARAQKIIRLGFEPQLSWHVDLTYAELAQQGKIRVYGCLPQLVLHPGWLRASSWDVNQIGPSDRYRTDTN